MLMTNPEFELIAGGADLVCAAGVPTDSAS
jgi:hypothetical protein